MPLGAASGGQQGAQNAAASATLRQRGLQRASRGRRFRVALPLWCVAQPLLNELHRASLAALREVAEDDARSGGVGAAARVL